MKKIALMAALVVTSFGVSASELMVTPAIAKNGTSVFSLDYVADGNVVAIQYNFALPKGVTADQVDLSQCAVDLPAGLEGGCSIAKGQIVGFAINDANVPFPAGVLPIGKISIAKTRATSLQVLNLVASDKNANQVGISSSFMGSQGEGARSERMVK